MMLIKKNFGILCLLILMGFGAFNPPTWAQSISHLKLDAQRVSWTGLSFHAKNFWVEVSTDIQLQSLRASDLDGILLPSPRGKPIKPLTAEAAQMTIDTTLKPKFRSPVNIHNRIWFNATDAAALGRIRLRRGEDDFKKIYRFTEQGVFRHRLEPKDKKEAQLEPEQWTDIKDSFYPYETTQLECAGVSERSVLLYILSAIDISKLNHPIYLCVFGKRQLHRVQLRHQGTQRLSIDYKEKNQQHATRRATAVNALKMQITALPTASDSNASENFSFLGLSKDIAIYIDPVSQLPIQASGIIPTVGTTQLQLHEYQTIRQTD